MLKEIHHRVKNNLQIIASLVHLQSEHIKDSEGLRAFLESRNRINTMALIHEKLYMSPDISRIDFLDYVNELANSLYLSYGIDRRNVALKLDIENVSFDINTAIPLGLIINELVSNALKYAFPGGIKGEIRIDLHQDDESRFILIIGDNGTGFPEDLDFRNTESLGLRLVISLTGQLGGTIDLDRKGGTTFRIIFKEQSTKKINKKI